MVFDIIARIVVYALALMFNFCICVIMLDILALSTKIIIFILLCAITVHFVEKWFRG